jgi:hypothetical protein
VIEQLRCGVKYEDDNNDGRTINKYVIATKEMMTTMEKK